MLSNIAKKVSLTLDHYPCVGNVFDSFLFPNVHIKTRSGIPTLARPLEREIMYILAGDVKNGEAILEIGAYNGGMTYFLSKGAITGVPVYSIDPFNSNNERQNIEKDNSRYHKNKKPSLEEVKTLLLKKGVKNVTLLQGFSEDYATEWKFEKIGLLWIDGNHLEAKKDFLLWKEYLAPNATVAFHDTGFPKYGKPEVTRDVEEIIALANLSQIERYQSVTFGTYKG